jgi:hypothetical protein
MSLPRNPGDQNFRRDLHLLLPADRRAPCLRRLLPAQRPCLFSLGFLIPRAEKIASRHSLFPGMRLAVQ